MERTYLLIHWRPLSYRHAGFSIPCRISSMLPWDIHWRHHTTDNSHRGTAMTLKNRKIL